MRVLMVSKAVVVGIYQRKLEEIARHEDIDLLALTPGTWRDERGRLPLERVYTTGYTLETLPVLLNGSYHLHIYRGLRDRMAAFAPDIVHIDEEPYNAAAWQVFRAARYCRAKTLFFSWQNILRTYPPPFRWGERWLMRGVDHVIAGTQSAADVWRAKGYTGPLAVIPQFGTDPHLFTPASTRPNRPFTIGFVGRLVEEKGVHVLLDAVAGLPGDWRLRIFGGGPERKNLSRQADALKISDRVEFVGQVPSPQMPDHYRGLDALAVPSLTRPNWKEQFGRVLTEAMATGVPVIGSDSGAIPDVIGEAGLVVPEGDVAALTRALTALQHDSVLRKHYGWMGRERVLDHFTHAQVAADTVAVYRAMMT